jgi:hypothetical protein
MAKSVLQAFDSSIEMRVMGDEKCRRTHEEKGL